jgi:hypothetical protein
MTSLPQIQNRLRYEFNELCEACFAEQAWLEEGQVFNPDEAKHLHADRRKPAAAAGAESVDP